MLPKPILKMIININKTNTDLAAVRLVNKLFYRIATPSWLEIVKYNCTGNLDLIRQIPVLEPPLVDVYLSDALICDTHDIITYITRDNKLKHIIAILRSNDVNDVIITNALIDLGGTDLPRVIAHCFPRLVSGLKHPKIALYDCFNVLFARGACGSTFMLKHYFNVPISSDYIFYNNCRRLHPQLSIAAISIDLIIKRLQTLRNADEVYELLDFIGWNNTRCLRIFNEACKLGHIYLVAMLAPIVDVYNGAINAITHRRHRVIKYLMQYENENENDVTTLINHAINIDSWQCFRVLCAAVTNFAAVTFASADGTSCYKYIKTACTRSVSPQKPVIEHCMRCSTKNKDIVSIIYLRITFPDITPAAKYNNLTLIQNIDSCKHKWQTILSGIKSGNYDIMTQIKLIYPVETRALRALINSAFGHPNRITPTDVNTTVMVLAYIEEKYHNQLAYACDLSITHGQIIDLTNRLLSCGYYAADYMITSYFDTGRISQSYIKFDSIINMIKSLTTYDHEKHSIIYRAISIKHHLTQTNRDILLDTICKHGHISPRDCIIMPGEYTAFIISAIKYGTIYTMETLLKKPASVFDTALAWCARHDISNYNTLCSIILV